MIPRRHGYLINVLSAIYDLKLKSSAWKTLQPKLVIVWYGTLTDDVHNWNYNTHACGSASQAFQTLKDLITKSVGGHHGPGKNHEVVKVRIKPEDGHPDAYHPDIFLDEAEVLETYPVNVRVFQRHPVLEWASTPPSEDK